MLARFKLSALLLAVSVFTLAAVGNSAAYKSGSVRLKDFDQTQDVLLGYPNDSPPLGWYLRTDQTATLPALIDPHRPPNPCRAYSVVWNIILAKVPASPERVKAQDAIIRQMANHDCLANITRDESQLPAPIVDIRPTP